MGDVQKVVEKGTTHPEPVIGSGKFFLPEKRRVVLKRAYQNRAVQKRAKEQQDQLVQISLPMAEVLTSLEQGLGELVRKVGRHSSSRCWNRKSSRSQDRVRAEDRHGRLTAGAWRKARV